MLGILFFIFASCEPLRRKKMLKHQTMQTRTAIKDASQTTTSVLVVVSFIDITCFSILCAFLINSSFILLNLGDIIEIDALNQRLYWASSYSGTIGVANMDGSNYTVLYDVSSGATNVNDIRVDAAVG